MNKYKDYENYGVEFFKDILNDLMYLNLEYDARFDRLNNYGLAMLIELRADKKYSLENRQKRYEELNNLVTSLDLSTNGAKGKKGIGYKDE